MFEQRWTSKVRGLVTASVIAGERLITAEWSGAVTAWALDHGKKLWAAKVGEHVGEPLAVHDGMVWVLDGAGAVTGLDLETGERRREHRLAIGGWGVCPHGGRLYFVDRTNRPVFRAGVPAPRYTGTLSFLELASGQVTALAAGVTNDANGWKHTTRVRADRGTVMTFLAEPPGLPPAIVEVGLDDGAVRARHELPGVTAVSGLLVEDDLVVAIVERDSGWDTSKGAASYLEYNPEPIVFIRGGARFGYALRASGSFEYTTSALRLDDGSYLIEAAECLFRVDRDGIRAASPLPARRIWGDRSAGMFRFGDAVVVLRRDQVEDDYVLDVLGVDPDSDAISPLGPPLVTNPAGKHHRGGTVERADDLVIVRADARLHCLRWR